MGYDETQESLPDGLFSVTVSGKPWFKNKLMTDTKLYADAFAEGLLGLHIPKCLSGLIEPVVAADKYQVGNYPDNTTFQVKCIDYFTFTQENEPSSGAHETTNGLEGSQFQYFKMTRPTTATQSIGADPHARNIEDGLSDFATKTCQKDSGRPKRKAFFKPDKAAPAHVAIRSGFVQEAVVAKRDFKDGDGCRPGFFARA